MKHTIFLISILFLPAIAQSSSKPNTQEHKVLSSQVHTLETEVTQLHSKFAKIDILLAKIEQITKQAPRRKFRKTTAQLQQIYSSNSKH